MTSTGPAARPREAELLPALDDPRVSAVLAVLRGAALDVTAERSDVDSSVLARWVGTFVTAGVAAVVDRPDPLVALQRQRMMTTVKSEIREPLARARAVGGHLARREGDAELSDFQLGLLLRALELLDERVGDAELLVAAALGSLEVRREAVTVGATCAGLDDLGEIGGKGPDHVVEVDPPLFGRVLRDVWAAADLSPDPQPRRMHVRCVGPWVEWRVLCGPQDPVHLHALFEPFEHDRVDTGGGFGLYLARALAVAHGGLVGVDQDDSGAAFWVRIPASSPVTTRLAPGRHPRSTR